MEHIKVNLPSNRDDFEYGNGEGCWVLVEPGIKEQCEAGYEGGNFEGLLDNDSFYYPDLKAGTTIRFEMRGECRPVAFIEDGLDQYRVLDKEEFHQLFERLNFKNQSAILSKNAYENKTIGFLLRDYPEDDNGYSGWIAL